MLRAERTTIDSVSWTVDAFDSQAEWLCAGYQARYGHADDDDLRAVVESALREHGPMVDVTIEHIHELVSLQNDESAGPTPKSQTGA